MTGELLTKAYVQTIVPRSTEKLMDYVLKELGDECACPLRLEGHEVESFVSLTGKNLTLGV